jgi:hypothetical protein
VMCNGTLVGSARGGLPMPSEGRRELAAPPAWSLAVGMGRLERLGLEQPVRCERQRPGEPVRIDSRSSGGSKAKPDGSCAAAHTVIDRDPKIPPN